MLGAFRHPIATCCNILGVVGSNLTVFKFEPTTSNMPQHIAIRWLNVQHVAPNSVAICCVSMFRSSGRGLCLRYERFGCGVWGLGRGWSSLLVNGTTHLFRPWSIECTPGSSFMAKSHWRTISDLFWTNPTRCRPVTKNFSGKLQSRTKSVNKTPRHAVNAFRLKEKGRDLLDH